MLDTEHGPVLDVCVSVPANLSHIDTNMHGPRHEAGVTRITGILLIR